MAQSGKHDGFYCKVCDCTVKDSSNYSDHINGKKHNKALGISLKNFTDSTLDEVKAMYEKKIREKAEKAMSHIDEEKLPNLYEDEDDEETEEPTTHQKDADKSTDNENDGDEEEESDSNGSDDSKDSIDHTKIRVIEG